MYELVAEGHTIEGTYCRIFVGDTMMLWDRYWMAVRVEIVIEE